MFNRIHKGLTCNITSRIKQYGKQTTLCDTLHNKFEEYKTQLDKQTFDTIFDFETNVLLLYYDIKTSGCYFILLNDIKDFQTKITEKVQLLNKIR